MSNPSNVNSFISLSAFWDIIYRFKFCLFCFKQGHDHIRYYNIIIKLKDIKNYIILSAHFHFTCYL